MDSSASSDLIERWRQGYDCPTSAPDPNLGPTGNFYNAILRLFTKLVTFGKQSLPLSPQEFQTAKYSAELHRYYVWGSDVSAPNGQLDKILARSSELQHNVWFLLEQLSRTLHTDLFRLLHADSSFDEELRNERQEVVEMQKTVVEMLSDTDFSVDAGSDVESLSSSRASEPSGDEILNAITTYIDCLMDLCDAIENPAPDWADEQEAALGNEIFNVAPGAERHCRQIRDQYPDLPKYLVERLGTLNDSRYARLTSPQNPVPVQITVLDRNENKSDKSREPPSEDLLSGASSHRPTTATDLSDVFDESPFPRMHQDHVPEAAPPSESEDADDDAASAFSVTTYRTTESTRIKGRRTVPQGPPETESGRPFNCNICKTVVGNIRGRPEWKQVALLLYISLCTPTPPDNHLLLTHKPLVCQKTCFCRSSALLLHGRGLFRRSYDVPDDEAVGDSRKQT
jgi:hypothetical protein